MTDCLSVCLSVRKDIKFRLQLCRVTHRDESEGLNKAGGRHVVCDVKRVDLVCDFTIFPVFGPFSGGESKGDEEAR